jgi:organic radical activating enzyme
MAFLGPLVSAGLNAALPALTQGAGELLGDLAHSITGGEPFGIDMLASALRHGVGGTLRGLLSSNGTKLRMLPPSGKSLANARPVMASRPSAASPGRDKEELERQNKIAQELYKKRAEEYKLLSPEAKAQRQELHKIRHAWIMKAPRWAHDKMEFMTTEERDAFVDEQVAKADAKSAKSAKPAKSAKVAKPAAAEQPKFKEYYADEVARKVARR